VAGLHIGKKIAGKEEKKAKKGRGKKGKKRERRKCVRMGDEG